MERSKYDMSFKYFLDMAPEEKVIHPSSLTKLQNRLRETSNIQMLIHYNVFVRDKQKGKNHDLTVAEYKVQQETKQKLKAEQEEAKYPAASYGA